MRSFPALLISASILMAAAAGAEDVKPSAAPVKAPGGKLLERITITGGALNVSTLPGSAWRADIKDEPTSEYTADILRVLSASPGVNIQEEDGFGHRPSIGMRGGRVERSSDITLMEDGVLIAPAPYAAPEAYYFPHKERLESLEVRKGSSSIKYGPRTTNGALNLITRSIPAELSGEVVGAIGTDGTHHERITFGDSREYFGYVLNLANDHTDGFKSIDTVGGDTGYTMRDAMGKFRLQTGANTNIYQSLELKLGFMDEDSDETYLGLTMPDFGRDPNRRYAASQRDSLESQHRQYQLRHHIEPGHGVDLTTTLYRNEFERAWYKLQSARVGTTKKNVSDLYADPTANNAFFDILKGGNSVANGLQIRDNKREYVSQGAESVLGYKYGIGDTSNQLEIGVRYHADEEDRFQRDDEYQMTGGVMNLTALGAPGSESNRIGSARAWAGFIQNELSWGKFKVTPGLRYESIDLENEDFGKSDPTRSGASKQTFTREVTALTPGIGASYQFHDQWTLFGGVHKGFAPPAPPKDAQQAATIEEEESINYELGLRHGSRHLKAELVGFLTNYDNLIGTDTFSSGGGGTGMQFNGGEAEAKGIEASLEYDLNALAKIDGYRFPLRASYTFTRAEFQSGFVSGFEEWKTVRAGDELPYIPEHQFHLSLGAQRDSWAVAVTGHFVDSMRTSAGSGALTPQNSTDAHFTVDIAGEVEVYKNVRWFAGVENIFDETYVAALRPAGARPGKPLTALTGIKYSF